MGAIVDYASLKTELSNFLKRSDAAAEYDVWIGLVESELNLELRLRQQLTIAALNAATDTVPLPTDFLQMRNLELATSPITPLRYVTSEQRDFYDLKSSTGKPRMYDISGANLILAPQPDQAYPMNIEYYAKIPSLPTNTGNWLIVNFPHLYLYGCLTQAGAYIKDTARLQIYVQAYTDAKAKLNAADDGAVYNSAPRVRPDVVV